MNFGLSEQKYGWIKPTNAFVLSEMYPCQNCLPLTGRVNMFGLNVL